MGSNIIGHGYVLPINIRQTVATVANTTVWSMRNLNDIALIRQIRVCVGFDPAVAGGVTAHYNFARFRGATPTGGTALVVQKMISQGAPSAVLDARFLDTGLTVAGVTFDQEFLTCRGQGNGGIAVYDWPGAGVEMAPFSIDLNDGLCIRLGTVATIGQWIAGSIWWEEQ